jgi:DNA-binding CsgD family transcriptional regulator
MRTVGVAKSEVTLKSDGAESELMEHCSKRIVHARRATAHPNHQEPGFATLNPPYPRYPNSAQAVKKIVLAYGLLGGLLIAALRLIEYRFLVLEHSLEIYGGIVALIFSALGIWLGLKLTRTRETVVVREVAVPVEVQVQVPVTGPFVRNEQRLEQLGITPREFEILEALAAGLSNREIAERLFVSENTVKTHAARLFDKLSARRRTQAVQLAKEAGLIP